MAQSISALHSVAARTGDFGVILELKSSMSSVMCCASGFAKSMKVALQASTLESFSGSVRKDCLGDREELSC